MNEKTKTGDIVLIKTIKKYSFQISIFIISLLLIVLLIGFSYSFSINKTANGKIQEAREYAAPSKLQIFTINCEQCSSISNIVNSIKKQNVNITHEEALNNQDNKAKELINKYNIQILPTVIISGEIDNNKTIFNNFDKINGTMILNKVNPPYLNITKNKLIGLVSLIELSDSSCGDCTDLSLLLDLLGQAGVIIGDWKKIEYNSPNGKELIKNYSIKHAPAMLFSENVIKYEGMRDLFAQLGSVNKKGFYAVHSTIPPYRNLTTGKIEGRVDLIMLTDNSCSSCYDVNINKQILQRFGIVPKTEENLDISSAKGKKLISKYGIKKVPIILVSPEANVYSTFVNAWSSVGSIEDNGWFIMRNPELIGSTTLLNSSNEN